MSFLLNISLCVWKLIDLCVWVLLIYFRDVQLRMERKSLLLKRRCTLEERVSTSVSVRRSQTI